MPDLPSRATLFRVGRDEILARQSKISRTAIESEGMDANALNAAGSAMGDQVVGQVAVAAAGLYLDSARGAALDRLVFDRYGLTRKPAAAAVGTVQFYMAAGSPVTFALPSGIQLQSSSGLKFYTTSSSTFVAGSTGPVTVSVRSALAGAGQGAKNNTITSITSQISGAPSGLLVNNPLATSASSDAETDQQLVTRARLFFATARRGTLAAIRQAALGVAGVSTAQIFEGIDAMGRPARYAQLVVADSFAEQFINSQIVPPSFPAQSQALASLVFDSLSDVRPAGIFIQVMVSNVILQSFLLALSFIAGADIPTATLQARSMIVQATNSLAPGTPWILKDMLKLLGNVQGLVKDSSGNVPASTIAVPNGDIFPTPLQVIRTSLSLVSAGTFSDQPALLSSTNPDAFIAQ